MGAAGNARYRWPIVAIFLHIKMMEAISSATLNTLWVKYKPLPVQRFRDLGGARSSELMTKQP